MTVAQLHEQMSHREFVEWSMFHARKTQRRELAALKSKQGR